MVSSPPNLSVCVRSMRHEMLCRGDRFLDAVGRHDWRFTLNRLAHWLDRLRFGSRLTYWFRWFGCDQAELGRRGLIVRLRLGRLLGLLRLGLKMLQRASIIIRQQPRPHRREKDRADRARADL